MSSPIAIGARSTTAPPGDRKSAPLEQEPHDRLLLAAVRAGDLHAYGTLYERHAGAARSLARRLCTNRADVDDVVGDAFTNTLRAIKAGRGPRDDMRSYLLTAVRNTVIKSRTRRDPARAVPTDHEQLDGPEHDDPYRCADPIAHAFVQLPDRFRDVLWSTCVEGFGPQDVAARTAMSTGAVTSLTLRARRALMRTYFVSSIEQPEASAECAPVRQLFPTVLEGEAAPSTSARVEAHVATCPNCEVALAEMRVLAAHVRSSFPWFAAGLAWIRMFLSRAAAPASGAASTATGGSTLVAAVMLMALATGDRPPSDTTPEALSPSRAASSIAVTADTAAAWAQAESPASEPRPPATAHEARPGFVPVAGPSPATVTVTVREPESVPVAADALEPPQDPAPRVPADALDPFDPEPIAEPVVGLLLEPVEPAVNPIVSTAATAAELILDDVVLPVAETAGTTVAAVTEVAATVVTEATEVIEVIQPAVEATVDAAIVPVAEVVDTSGAAVAETVDGVLGVVDATDTLPTSGLAGAVEQPVVRLL